MLDETQFLVIGPDAPMEVVTDYKRIAELFCEHGPERLMFHVLTETDTLAPLAVDTVLQGKDDQTKYYMSTLTCYATNNIYNVTWEC